VGLFGLWAAAGCGSEGAASDACEEDPCACGIEPDLALEPVREPAVAFDVRRDGVTERYEWLAAAGDTIECRRLDCEQLQLAVVFAAQGGAPRLELEACGVVDSSLLPPFPRTSTDDCEERERGFVVRWVDGEVWQSEPGSPACQLNMTRREGTITGTFECGALRSAAGTEVRLGTGSFECTVER
jgi:hypothetical protein